MIHFSKFLTLYHTDEFFRKGVDDAMQDNMEIYTKPFMWKEDEFARYGLGYDSGVAEMRLHNIERGL